MAKQNNTTETEQNDLGISLELIDVDDTFISELTPTPTEPKVKNETNDDENPDLTKVPEGIETGDFDINKFFEDNKNDNSEPLDSTTKTTEPQKDKPITTKEGKDTKDVSGSLTVAFAKTLFELQGSSEFNEEEYTKAIAEKGEAAALMELLETEATKKAEVHKSTVDAYAQEYIKLREAGFSTEEASTLVGNKETIDSINDEQLEKDEELQTEIIREIGGLRGMSEQEVEDDIKLLKDNDKLYERAKKGKELLKDYYVKVADSQLKQRQEAVKKAEEDRVKAQKELRDTINSTDEIIKGKKINQQTKDKIYKMITEPVKTADGKVINAVWAKRSENPMEFDKKLAYLISIGMFDGTTDPLVTDARTKALTTLQKELEGGRKFTAGQAIIPGSQTLADKVNVMEEFKH